MANPWAGEVALVIDGKRHVLKLTLGALAALEAQLEVGSLIALAERFEGGRFRTTDILAVLRAGLVGGGTAPEAAVLAEDGLAGAEFEGGPMAAARAAAELLARAFHVPGSVA